MNTTDPLTMVVATCGLLFLAIGLPLSIWYGARKIRGPHAGEIIHRAGQRARSPWEQEDAGLEELSRRVEPYKNAGSSDPQPPSDTPGSQS